MSNPWQTIRLSDYENHMRLDTVKQLQTLNSMMKKQLSAYAADSIMILGIAGGNGLEHIQAQPHAVVYGVDINAEYLQAVEERYQDLTDRLKCLCVDLTGDVSTLPSADFVIANLLIEYIGYGCFQKVVKQVMPKYVSCGIQINTDDGFVSDSPYLHSFDGLNSIHRQMETDKLARAMSEIGYRAVSDIEYPLPNGKKLVQMDFEC